MCRLAGKLCLSRQPGIFGLSDCQYLQDNSIVANYSSALLSRNSVYDELPTGCMCTRGQELNEVYAVSKSLR